MSRDHRESNRLSWNAATRAHNSHKQDQAAFLRAGARRTTLPPADRPALPMMYGVVARKPSGQPA